LVGSNRTVDVSLHNANGIPLASKPGDISSLGLTSAAGTTALLSNSGLAVLAATGIAHPALVWDVHEDTAAALNQ
jgi:hypothetical protein